MERLRKGLYLTMMLICFPSIGWGAERLSTTMGEILLRNLQPGTTYQLTPMMKIPFSLSYEGDRPITLKIDPSLPDVNEGKVGFEHVPSLNWIQCDPASFDIESSSTVHSNVTITIPEDETIRGKKYIVYLWAKALGKGPGMGVGVGLKSRLLVTIAKEKSSQESQGGSSYLNYKLEPGYVNLEIVEPGKKFRVDKMAGSAFKLINYGDQEMSFKLQVVSGDSLDLPPPQGSLWGSDRTQIQISPSNLKLKGGEEGRFKVFMKIPDEPEFYGKNSQYLIRVTPEGTAVSTGVLLRIQVKTSGYKEK